MANTYAEVMLKTQAATGDVLSLAKGEALYLRVSGVLALESYQGVPTNPMYLDSYRAHEATGEEFGTGASVTELNAPWARQVIGADKSASVQGDDNVIGFNRGRKKVVRMREDGTLLPRPDQIHEGEHRLGAEKQEKPSNDPWTPPTLR